MPGRRKSKEAIFPFGLCGSLRTAEIVQATARLLAAQSPTHPPGDPRIMHRPTKQCITNSINFSLLTTMDFAPYQDTAPESTRALSPSPNPNRTTSPARNTRSPPPNRSTTDPFGTSSLPAPSHFSNEPQRNGGFGGGNIEGGRLDVNPFETSLPLRLKYEAMLAYLLLPPAGGVFLLVVEHKSDYVRYVWLWTEKCQWIFGCGESAIADLDFEALIPIACLRCSSSVFLTLIVDISRPLSALFCYMHTFPYPSCPYWSVLKAIWSCGLSCWNSPLHASRKDF